MLIDALGAEGWYVSLLGVEIWEVRGNCGYLIMWHVAGCIRRWFTGIV